jgi:hypothetical protein
MTGYLPGEEVWDIFFSEMQNGAIWGHFRVSYNIESSTILIHEE